MRNLWEAGWCFDSGERDKQSNRDEKVWLNVKSGGVSSAAFPALYD